MHLANDWAMKVTLPIIGQIRLGKDAKKVDLAEPVITQVENLQDKEKFFDVLGGLLQFTRGTLSDEKSVSSKVLEANKEWIYRNNDVIAQEVSKMEFQLYIVGLKEGEIVYNEVQEHPLLDLLDKFNSTTTRSDGVYITQSHKKLAGDAFWLLDRNGKLPDNIFILPPDKIELKLGDPTDGTADLVEGYIYKDVIDGKKIEIVYDRNDIIHFKKPNPKNPFRGYGIVEAIADTIDADNLSNLTQRNFFEKGAISNFVLTTDAKITQDQLKRVRAELRANYSGAKNAYTTMIFGNGLKPAGVGFSNKDMQFLDILEWYRDKIMVNFGNTKATLGIIEDVNRASFTSAYSSWLRGTIKPDMSAIVGTLNEFLVPLYGKNLVLGYTDPVPEDNANDRAEAVELKQAGVITINEARELVGQDPIPGGDIFAPNGAMAVPGSTNDATDTTAASDTDQAAKVYSRMKRLAKKQGIPAGLAHLDLDQLLRSRKIFSQQRMNREFKEAAKPAIRQLLKSKVVKIAPRLHAQFSNEQVNTYYAKQIHTVEVLEGRFKQAILSLLERVQSQALHNLDNEIKSIRGLKRFMVNKELFDTEELKVAAQLDLTPILMQELILAGQEAYRLIDSEDTYIPHKAADVVSQYVDKFAQSMLETDRKILTDIIADGIEQGRSIPQIRQSIQTGFGEYSKMQAERIARTEVLRVSNLAAEDAFMQSGVVEAKQWLVAPGADAECLPYNGKIIKLGGDFYDPENEFEDGNPPRHPNCRCILVPIVVGARGFEPTPASERELYQRRIAELEAQIDKRTKAFKELHLEKADDKAYIKALERHLKLEADDE